MGFIFMPRGWGGLEPNWEGLKVGLVSTALGFFGFGAGLTAGVVVGYYIFIHFQPSDVKDPKIRPLVEHDTQSLECMLPEIPLWVKYSDYDRETIKNQVANMFLWPRILEVPVLDVSKASKRPVGILHVKIIRAYKLRKLDFFGKSDPYVKLKLSDEKLPSKKTSVKHGNLDPEWNEEFKFVIKDPENQVVELNVYDWEKVGQHERMGMNVIQLNELTPDGPKTLTLNLLKNLESRDESHGHIVVEVTFKPFKEEDLSKDISENAYAVEDSPDYGPSGGGLLVIIVHEAHDLEGKHHTNPYARILFRGDKRKTKHIKNNRDPRWEEEFQFVCEAPPVNEKMQVEVLSKAPIIGIYSKEILGYVTISLADVVNNKRTNNTYHLIDSNNGQIQIEIQWKTS
ncbi:Plant synaptotagmin [Musa troglodytarum]|uniref:Plant synaptotagmin n=1 Tax=Musa troglodytarum TaxID=320322 RepID=A0A9E7EF37_9LILI|nr:Plant synaptotagmin [Musa troglodytarum]